MNRFHAERGGARQRIPAFTVTPGLERRLGIEPALQGTNWRRYPLMLATLTSSRIYFTLFIEGTTMAIPSSTAPQTPHGVAFQNSVPNSVQNSDPNAKPIDGYSLSFGKGGASLKAEFDKNTNKTTVTLNDGTGGPTITKTLEGNQVQAQADQARSELNKAQSKPGHEPNPGDFQAQMDGTIDRQLFATTAIGKGAGDFYINKEAQIDKNTI